MFQILHLPGLEYANETREQAEERERRIAERNRKIMEEYKAAERQRLAPMKSMQKWVEQNKCRVSSEQ